MSAIDISRGRCCCFTGHSHDKLNMPEHELREALKCEIEAAIEDGYDIFISGMARGVDICAAEECAGRKRTHPDVAIDMRIPYPNSAEAFSHKWRTRAAASTRRRC